jgi:flagellar biosynthesis/type III secretory pathway protein FliH
MSLAEIDAMLYEQVFGPKIRLGEEKGLQAGLQAGLQQGLQQGSYNTVKILLETRFGQLSPEIAQKLAALSATDLEALIPRSLNAESIAELFPE